MANVNAPIGLIPVGTTTGSAFNEQGRLYYISASDTNTFAIGDIVKTAQGNDANGIGQVTKAAATDTPLGVIVGVRPANPGVSLQGTVLDLGKLYIPASSGVSQYVYVCDVPTAVFEIQASTTANTYVGSTAIPTITAVQSSLSQYSPQSSTYVVIDSTPTTTSMFQVIGVSQRPDNVLGAYNKVLVTWNKHQYFGAY